MRIAGLASTRGRSLLNVADRAPGGATVEVVVTDQPGAPVVDGADQRGIDAEVVAADAGEDRDSHEERILETLAEYDPDLVLLDGYVRVLTESFIREAPVTLNSHPSLLPSFTDTDAWEAALDRGVGVSGATVTVVSPGGEDQIVTQEPVPVYRDDSKADLIDRVLYEGEFVAYPRAVRWFAEGRVTVDEDRRTVEVDGDEGGKLPERYLASAERVRSLRYGENPHQDAALYADPAEGASVVRADQRNPDAKAMSYNNYNDADAALGLVADFDRPAAAVIKHTNPAGCATADSISDAYERALSTDPMSAYGGIVALNRTCDRETAAAIDDSFKEVVVAPGYTDAAVEQLRERESLRILDVGEIQPPDERPPSTVETALAGGRLIQDRDDQRLSADDLEVVTEREPTDDQVESMLFAWQVVKHVKSNAIVFADGGETVGIGAGQMSRKDAVRIARTKAAEDAEGKSADGAVMASDAFFPFPDAVEVAVEAGVEAVIQPGGSVNDEDVVEYADEAGIAMVFTGQRAFRHD